jgi:rubrerythrin
MNSRIIAVLVALAAAPMLFSEPVRAQKPTSAESREVLKEAMRKEAFAAAKYKLFSENARKAGNKELADLMIVASNIELGHFLRWAGMYGLVGTDFQNLKMAIEDESDEDIQFYVRIAAEAAARGDTSLASSFNEVRAQEEKQRAKFEEAMGKTSQSQ